MKGTSLKSKPDFRAADSNAGLHSPLAPNAPHNNSCVADMLWKSEGTRSPFNKAQLYSTGREVESHWEVDTALLVLCLETGPHCVVVTGLELADHLPLPLSAGTKGRDLHDGFVHFLHSEPQWQTVRMQFSQGIVVDIDFGQCDCPCACSVTL